jgi:hypothetical protein
VQLVEVVMHVWVDPLVVTKKYCPGDDPGEVQLTTAEPVPEVAATAPGAAGATRVAGSKVTLPARSQVPLKLV